MDYLYFPLSTTCGFLFIRSGRWYPYCKTPTKLQYRNRWAINSSSCGPITPSSCSLLMEWKQKSSSAGKAKKVEPKQHPCPCLWAVGTQGSCGYKFVFPSGSDSFPFAVDLLIVPSGNGCHSGLMLFFFYHHLPATNSLSDFQLLVINKYIWTEPTLPVVSAVRSKNPFSLFLAIWLIWIKISAVSILLLFLYFD